MKRNIHRLLILFNLLLWTGILQAQSADSTVEFKIRNAGVNVTGSFAGLVTEINFDQGNLSGSRIFASVDATTIKTGIKLRDKHLNDEDYFHTEAFPRISMTSKSFRSTGGQSYEGIFTLELKGVKKEVNVPFEYREGWFRGEFEINRRDFGVGGKNWFLSDNVKILLSVKDRSSQ